MTFNTGSSSASGILYSNVTPTQAEGAGFNYQDVKAQVHLGLGLDPDQLETSENVFGIIIDMDDSTSMNQGNKRDDAITGINQFIEDLRNSKLAGDVLIALRYLNRGTICEFTLLENFPEVSRNTFAPNGVTPIYDAAIIDCALLKAKQAEMLQSGIHFRAMSLLVTDGEEYESMHTVGEAKNAIEVLKNSEAGQFTPVIMGVGIKDAKFSKLVTDLGYDDHCVLRCDERDFLKKLKMVSQSAVRLSQGNDFGGFLKS